MITKENEIILKKYLSELETFSESLDQDSVEFEKALLEIFMLKEKIQSLQEYDKKARPVVNVFTWNNGKKIIYGEFTNLISFGNKFDIPYHTIMHAKSRVKYSKIRQGWTKMRTQFGDILVEFP